MNSANTSIIIINWNGLNDTINCIKSIQSANIENIDIIVVDNGSANQESEKLKKIFKSKIILLEAKKNLGFTGGNNLGIAYAKKNLNPDFYLLLNNDTLITKDFLTPMIALLKNNKTAGICGSKIVDHKTKQIQSAGIKLNNWTCSTHLNKNSNTKVNAVSGCSFLIKKAVIEKIGSLDDDYFCYYEEIDYCTRAKKTGFRTLLCSSSEIIHLGQSSANKVPGFHEYQLIKNRFLFCKKNCSRLQKITTALYVSFIYSILRSANLIRTKQFKTNIRFFLEGYKDGLKILLS